MERSHRDPSIGTPRATARASLLGVNRHPNGATALLASGLTRHSFAARGRASTAGAAPAAGIAVALDTMPLWETTTTFGLPLAGTTGKLLREAVRAAAVLGLIALLGYSVLTAWTVLSQLEHVTLAECKHALDVVSVRDALLCVLGYRIGTELLRAVVRARRSE